MFVEPLADLNAVAGDWATLWRATPDATPFQHPAWLIPWWKSFGSGRLYSFAVRDEDGKLRLLALLFLHQWEGRRQVTFLGNGVSDEQDFLGDESLTGLVLEALAARRADWDLCDLQELPVESQLLKAALPHSIVSETLPQSVCSKVTLECSLEIYKAGLPHGLRRNLRRYRKQLEEQGEVKFETADANTFEPLLDALFELHRARWTMKDDRGMLDGPQMETFHREAACELYRAGLARLNALRMNGLPVAITYELLHGSRVLSYLGGFSPSLAQYGVGKLIQEYAIDQAIVGGAQVFDFLRGDEPYKLDWGAKRSMTMRLQLYPA